eukprot:256686-Amphidinium_carterae.1
MVRVASKYADDVWAAYVSHWVAWMGHANTLVVDQGRELAGDLATQAGAHGVAMMPTATGAYVNIKGALWKVNRECIRAQDQEEMREAEITDRQAPRLEEVREDRAVAEILEDRAVEEIPEGRVTAEIPEDRAVEEIPEDRIIAEIPEEIPQEQVRTTIPSDNGNTPEDRGEDSGTQPMQ